MSQFRPSYSIDPEAVLKLSTREYAAWLKNSNAEVARFYQVEHAKSRTRSAAKSAPRQFRTSTPIKESPMPESAPPPPDLNERIRQLRANEGIQRERLAAVRHGHHGIDQQRLKEKLLSQLSYEHMK